MRHVEGLECGEWIDRRWLEGWWIVGWSRGEEIR